MGRRSEYADPEGYERWAGEWGHEYGWDNDIICPATKYGTACSVCETDDCPHPATNSLWSMPWVTGSCPGNRATAPGTHSGHPGAQPDDSRIERTGVRVMAGWLFVLLVAVAVGAVSAVLLVVLAAVGSCMRLSSGPVVVSARAVAVVLLLAVLVALGSGLWGSVAGMLAAVGR